MITAHAKASDGTRIIVLGVTRENIARLTAGSPIYVNAEKHAGFPADLKIAIFFGETEAALMRELKPMVGDQTKVIVVPKDTGEQH